MTDLSKLPVVMQGSQPCCVEAAATAYVEYLLMQKTGVYTELSFRYLATKTAAIDNINYVTSGTSLSIALEVLKNTGICTAATFPNNINVSPTEFIMPSLVPEGADEEAANYKISGYSILEDISWNSVNTLLASNLVLTGLYLDQAWYLSSQGNPMPLPPPTSSADPSISKHMTLSYGFDGTNRWVRNSFGNTFGQNGNGYYTAEYQPWIFSAATIESPLQIVTQEIQQVEQDITKINPQTPSTPQQENLIEQVVEDITKEIKEIL